MTSSCHGLLIPAALRGGRRRPREHHDGWSSDRCIAIGTGQTTRDWVDAETRDSVGPLVATIQVLSAGIDGEATWIVAARPGLPHKSQLARRTKGERGDAVVQPIGRIEESSITGNTHLRGEVGPGKTSGQGRDLLPLVESARCGIEVEEDEGGSLFLQRIDPSAIGMKDKVPRAIARRYRDVPGWIELTGLLIQSPEVDRIGSEIGTKHKLARRIGFDHVRVGAIVATDRKTAGRRAGRMDGPRRWSVFRNVSGGGHAAIGQDRQHGKASTVIVRYQQMFACGMYAEVCRTGTFGGDGIESGQVPRTGVFGIRRDCPGHTAVKMRDFIGGVQILARGMKGQPGGVQFVLADLSLRQNTGRRLHRKEVDPPPSPRAAFRPLRRAVASDIGQHGTHGRGGAGTKRGE